MRTAAVDGRIRAEYAHHVDVAALGPSDDVEVVPKHPERAPWALPGGSTRAHLETPVHLVEPSLRLHARRGVVEPHVRLRSGADDEGAIAVQKRILFTCREELDFPISPSVSPDVVGPHRGVGRRARRPVELVVPDQTPGRRW